MPPAPPPPGHDPIAADASRRFSRVAISHEWLTIPGGSEKVVLRLLALFPDAELFTSVYDPAPWPAAITERPVHASPLNRIPGAPRIYPRLLPLMNAAFESFDLSGFDLVISSNHSCAKNVLTRPDTLHVCYCHTPMRHAWEPGFLEGEGIGRLGRAVAGPLLGRLRREDLAASARPDHFLANSSHVAGRIAKYYRRESRVLHPPVDVAKLLDSPRDEQDYYLFLGRLVPYKRPDLALEACARLGRPIVVIGDGRAAPGLREAAGPGARFLGHVDDETLISVLSGARALLFPGEEDFGMVPVEAQAAGVPVIAYGVGGARDSVVDGVTGVLFDQQGVEGLTRAILEFESTQLEERAIRDNARRFAPERFTEGFAAFLDEVADEGVPTGY